MCSAFRFPQVKSQERALQLEFKSALGLMLRSENSCSLL